jgi:hypothetical protein
VNARLFAVSLLAPAIIVMAPIARAEAPKNVDLEINFLLGFVEGSGCQFYRNGLWYESKAAQEHLREKYEFLNLRNLVNTTEQFIDRAATESSFSGLPYEVRCNGGAVVTSRQWLTDELARLRRPH